MARNTLTKITPVGPYPTLQPAVNTLDLTFTAADVTGDPQKEQFLPAADNLLLIWNKAVGAKTFTVTSVADDKNRTGLFGGRERDRSLPDQEGGLDAKQRLYLHRRGGCEHLLLYPGIELIRGVDL
jgi:hypothetical protein